MDPNTITLAQLGIFFMEICAGIAAVGTNDPGDGFEAAYDDAINKMHTKYGTDVICLAPFTGAHYSQIRTIAGNYSWAHYVGVDRTGITFTDGVHPDAAGAKIAGERTAEQLTAIYGEHYFE